MKTYIYVGNCSVYYYDMLVVQTGNIIKADSKRLKNISNKMTFTEIPYEIIKHILDNCKEYNPENITELSNDMKKVIELNKDIIPRLVELGILRTSENDCRNYNVGKSNYSKHIIQPWAIWSDYNLNPWDADIVKRVLRTKQESNMSEIDSRIMDYEKIIHICNERIRQLKN